MKEQCSRCKLFVKIANLKSHKCNPLKTTFWSDVWLNIWSAHIYICLFQALCHCVNCLCNVENLDWICISVRMQSLYALFTVTRYGWFMQQVIQHVFLSLFSVIYVHTCILQAHSMGIFKDLVPLFTLVNHLMWIWIIKMIKKVVLWKQMRTAHFSLSWTGEHFIHSSHLAFSSFINFLTKSGPLKASARRHLSFGSLLFHIPNRSLFSI